MKFRFRGIPDIQGKVLYSPVATGDCWIVEDPQGGHWFIQQYDAAFLYPEGRRVDD